MIGRFRYYSCTFKSTPESVSATTAWIRETAQRLGLDAEHVFYLDVCATELLANVAEHASRAGEVDVDLGLLLDRDIATLTIVDSGSEFDPLKHLQVMRGCALPDAASQGGFGLRLIKEFSDEITYRRIQGRNRIRVRVRRQRARSRDRSRDADPADVLSRTSLFREIARPVLNELLADCEIESCDAGETLLEAGEHHRCVLVAIEGRLEVHLDDPASEFYIELAEGECVGELSVADAKPISAWVVSATACRLLVIPEPVFLESMLAVPGLARNLIVLLSQRMRRSNMQLVARLRAAMELDALHRELDLAHSIQASMLPPSPLLPDIGALDGHACMRAARHVGGDLYDVFSIGGGRVFVAIGDVCSKGAPAALFMVRALSVMRSEAMRLDADPVRHLTRLAARCNDLLSENNEAKQFVTLFCAIVDLERDQMYYANMGHLAPLLRTANGAIEWLADPRNPLAGCVSGLQFGVGSRPFSSGSMLLLYTDGVTEAENEGGELYGDDALFRLFAQYADLDAESMVKKVLQAVDHFVSSRPQADDIAVLALRKR